MNQAGNSRTRTEPRRRDAVLALVAGFALFVAADVALFYSPLYPRVLDPQSSAGVFRHTVAQFERLDTDRSRDVLVLGDSRIYRGLIPRLASRASGGLRVLSAAVPGTTPRCWPYLLRAIDPHADRFRAVVIPLDTLADDDAALGSIDGNDRPYDLHYLVFNVAPRDVPVLARSFTDLPMRLQAALDLLLRGPLLRSDAQDLLSDPGARLRAVAAAADDRSDSPLAEHPQARSLNGLQVDFVRHTIRYPDGLGSSEQEALASELLQAVHPSPSYAAYRRQWLGRIVERYRSTPTEVVFVRIPAVPVRSAPRTAVLPSSGSIAEFVRGGVALLPPAAYLALERPDLFTDHDHLDLSGAEQFSRLLGRDLSRALSAGVARRST